MAEQYFMKEPCKHCPFRRDVKPYLHPRRAEELAYATQNPYNSFKCHKTTVSSDDGNTRLATDKSKECAGFITMQIIAGMGCPKGFTPSDKTYDDASEMAEAYENEAE